MGFVNEKPGRNVNDWRTVNYEKEAVLKLLKGVVHGGGDWFSLEWRGEVVRFGAIFTAKYVNEGVSKDLIVVWKVFQCAVPSTLRDSKRELLQIIEEALAGHGHLYRCDNMQKITADFTKCLFTEA